jgi:hypothetical protein
MKTLKQELKLLVASIREHKCKFKDLQRSGSSSWEEWSKLCKSQFEFRHKHIAYCLLRGRTLEQIESSGSRCPKEKCYCCNKPDLKYVEKLLVELKEKEVSHGQETVRDCES